MREELLQVGVVAFICAVCSAFSYAMNRGQWSSDAGNGLSSWNGKNIANSVWLLYHAGWGNLETDKTWGTWRIKRDSWIDSWYEPPENVAIVHQPELGLYSSHNGTVLNHHLKSIQAMGVDALVVPWDGTSHCNDTTSFTDISIQMLFQLVPQYNLQIIPLLPTFEGRNETTIQQDLDYLKSRYSKEKGLYKMYGKPLVAIYDAHTVKESAFIINRNHDITFIAAALSYEDFMGAFEDGYAGFVSYFASDELSWCAKSMNWMNLVSMASNRDMFFVPTVSPGYNDSAVSRWNGRFWRDRQCDSLYENAWNTAINSQAKVVMINSWNNWPEGSVIEEVIETEKMPLTDKIWCGKDPLHFIKKTTEMIAKFKNVL